jgi:hypothetical protein
MAWPILAGALIFASIAAAAQQPANLPADPRTLVSQTVQNELNSQNTDHTLWAYAETKKMRGKTESMDVVETKDGEVDRRVSNGDEPLSASQQEKEDQRVRKLLDHPDQVRQQRRKQANDADEERKLVKMLPDAFVYTYDGTQDNEVKLRFRPNSMFHASGHEGQVFHAMEGEMKIDPRQKRLAEIDGHLTSEVKFGGGILGHLDKGGTFVVRQQDVGGGHWEMTYLNVKMNGKALFFKTIAVHENEVCSNFHRIPDETPANHAAQFLQIHDHPSN